MYQQKIKFQFGSSMITKKYLSKKDKIYCGNKSIDVFTFEELLPNGRKHISVYSKNFPYKDTQRGG